MSLTADDLNVFLLEDVVWCATAPVGVPIYDFGFDRFFVVRHPCERQQIQEAIGRFGAADDYSALYDGLCDRGVRLVHDPQMQIRASELPSWYPLISEFTPRSVWFPDPPTPDEIESFFEWPVFIKGSRQTSKHQVDLAIIPSREAYQQVVGKIRTDPVLHWQDIVIREFVPLRAVKSSATRKIPASFEFRTFWWRGECVGEGAYYAETAQYQWDRKERMTALSLAKEVVCRVDVTFLVVDLAQTATGEWIVIELNDGQESGYASIAPIGLWQKIVDIERRKRDASP